MSENFEIRLSDALKEAWAIFMKGPEVFVGFTFLYFAVVIVLGNIPLAGPFVSFLAWACFLPAIIAAADSSVGKERATFESVLGIGPLVPQVLALGVVKGLILTLGFMLLVLPGIFLAVILIFSELILLLEKRAFVDAMKESYQLASRNLLGVFGLAVFTLFFALSGLMLVGIGVLVTLPLSVLVLYCVYRRICVRVVAA
jgi:uncharacterized membrane protein